MGDKPELEGTSPPSQGHSHKIQVVNGEGEFQTAQLAQFVAETKLADMRTNYHVVAIMGPQSSGKSTLLNHVFGTSFIMMDAMSGRGQTTKGIWLSKSPKHTDGVVLVMDLEGSDGRERGEDDTNFERQSALFALSVADVLLVNIWCHDIGREHGSGKPLLKTIFQVNLKLFGPEPNRDKTVLLFVIRDKTKTPLSKLIEVMESDLNKMWDTISKPPQYKDSKIHDFFEIRYAALPHFEEKYEDFVADTVTLRRRFSPDADEALVQHSDKLPGDAFALSVKNIWEIIRSQKDLNLPAHKIMVANIRCNEIKNDQLCQLEADQAWRSLQAEAQAGQVVAHFNTRAHGLLDSCLKGYEAEASYFDAKVKAEKQQELLEKLAGLAAPLVAAQAAALQAAQLQQAQKELKLGLAEAVQQKAFAKLGDSVRSAALQAYRDAYAENIRIPDAPWDGKVELAQFQQALDEHISNVRDSKINEAVARSERQLAQLVSGPAVSMLDTCPSDVWPRLQSLCQNAAETTSRSLLEALDGFALDDAERTRLSDLMRSKSRERLEGHVREAALTRLSRMKDRFTEVFTLDEHKTPRMWNGRDDIPGLARKARLAAAHVLAQLCVIVPRSAFDSPGTLQPYHAVQDAVRQLAEADLADGPGSSSTGGSGGAADEQSLDVLSAASWPEVADELVLLQPHEVRATWREFMSASNIAVQQALSAQHANKMASNQPPPLWAIAAILFLGWNEFMAVIWNPVLLVVGLVLFLFGRTLYHELDVDSQMQKGALPGLLSIAARFRPALKNVMFRTLDSVKGFATEGVEALHQPQQARAPTARYAEQEEVASNSYGASDLHRNSSSSAAATGLTKRRPNAGADAARAGAEPANGSPIMAESRKDY